MGLEGTGNKDKLSRAYSSMVTTHHDTTVWERTMRSTPGLRKGAWTAEEDILLRKCIEKYGEGKWHQVPVRAGINRCRKSCRLRWLNYLKPDIKRGDFASDEIDLIIRLHKLLGNRWSLIAGRLPGRTANAVKNYWNTHLQKKITARKEPEESKAKNTHNTTKPMASNIVKPRAWHFSKNASWLWGKTTTSADTTTAGAKDTQTTVKDSFPTSQPTEKDNNLHWWDNFFHDLEGDDCEGTGWSLGGLGEDLITSLWPENLLQLGFEGDSCTYENHDGPGCSSIDANLCDFLISDQQPML